MPFTVISSDILSVDCIISMKENAVHRDVLDALIADYGLLPHGKAVLSKAQYDDFAARVQGLQMSYSPGGSAANTLTTLSLLLGDAIDARFIGGVGKAAYSPMILEALHRAGVKILPETGLSVEAAISFVLVAEDGSRTLASYPGNARSIMLPDIIQDGWFAKSGALMLQGSLWKKMDKSYPYALLAAQERHGYALWFCLPTYAGFDDLQAAAFRATIGRSRLVLGNDDELAITFQTMTDEERRVWDELSLERARREACVRLQALLSDDQVAFITRGAQGIVIVTEDTMEYVPAADIAPQDIVNTLGAGDTAFAGILAGVIKGFPLADCARMGAALAGQKLLINQSRLPDPRAALSVALPSTKPL